MLRVVKLTWQPVKYLWVIGILLAVGFGTGVVNIPGTASAQVAIDCRGEVIDNECVESDACWNIDGIQASVPDGYHTDQNQNNACVEDPADSGPQVLGTSTSTPQVLAETTTVSGGK